MLLTALQHLPRAEMKKVLRLSVAVSVRGLIVGGIGGGTTEGAYSAAAIKIRERTIKTASELRKELAGIIPSDDEFEAAFATARVSRQSLSRYYLNALERQEGGVSEPELVPNSDEEQVNLEHVLPKKATPTDWPSFSEEERSAYVDRLGNHALMKKTPNGRIGNKSFKVKAPELAKSALKLTKEIGSEDDWTPSEIEDRQRRLAKLAVLAWKVIF